MCIKVLRENIVVVGQVRRGGESAWSVVLHHQGPRPQASVSSCIESLKEKVLREWPRLGRRGGGVELEIAMRK